jgi:hypothetical protein
VGLYDLQHTYATLLLAVGEKPKIDSERLSYPSVTLTMSRVAICRPIRRKGRR